MPMPPTLQQVLARELSDPNITEADRAHLKRWVSEGHRHDHTWRRLDVAAEARGMLPRGSTYQSIIEEMLFMRQCAERAQSGIDFDLRERQEYHQRHLDLSKKAEDLADYFKWAAGYSGIADYFRRFFRPVDELEDFHRKEAEILRRRARRPPKPSLRISRQDRSKQNTGLRKINAFISLADGFIRDWICDNPDHEAVAVLTNVAFPGHHIVADDVRKALRPTTRQGRKQASRAHSQRKNRNECA
jgi:hypothetical protein